jgi:hypothetical protein
MTGLPLPDHGVFDHRGEISTERFENLAAVFPHFVDYGITIHRLRFRTIHQQCIRWSASYFAFHSPVQMQGVFHGIRF